MSAKKTKCEKSKNNKARNFIIISAVVLVVLAICTSIIIAVLKNDNDNTDPDADTPFQYPEYVSAKDTDTEGSYYNTTNTGVGTYVDMEKVTSQIDAYEYKDFAKSDAETDFVAVRVENYGDIIIALREDIAPLTVQNFKKLVGTSFYKNKIISRIEDFMVLGGGKTTSGDKTETDAVYGEFTENGHINNLLHVSGVVSMGRKVDRDSATSEFFIMRRASTDLDGLYATFGYVVAGYDVVNSISFCELEEDSYTNNVTSPVKQIVILDAFFVEPVKGTGLAVAEKPSHTIEQYEITVVDENKNPVSDVTFKLFDIATKKTPVYSYTDAEGKASFKISPADYRIFIISASGYEWEEYYNLPATKTKITIELKAKETSKQ